MKKVIVVGGAGFIGSHVVDLLLKKNFKVYVLDNFSTGSIENLGDLTRENLNIITCDISNDEVQNIIININPYVILLLAAQPSVIISLKNPILDAKSNIIGLLNILEGSRKSNCSKIIFASSGGTIYGNINPYDLPIKEDHPKKSRSFYGLTKLTAISYLELYKELFGIKYVALALGNIYGPRQSPDGVAGVISIFAKKILNSELCTINGDGSTTRDYVYVTDVAEAFVISISEGSGSINIGSGIETSVSEVYFKLLECSGIKGEYINGPELTGEVNRISLDPTRAKQELNWQASTNFDSGIKMVLNWIKTQLKL